MKLLTHNMLSSNIKGVTAGYPLLIEPQIITTTEVPINPNFLRHIFPKLDYSALVAAAKTLGFSDLPETAGVSDLEDEGFLKRFNHALLELKLEAGALVCPESGRRFMVSKGIPNMLLHEDEV
ncbi:hypothetical protein Droror1_Dr00014725 [Drosera rotundifolia]